jgi:hypothetical protein
MNAGRVETGLRGQAAQDEKRSGARERPALRVEEELRSVSSVEERPAAGQIPAYRLDSFAPERDDALLVSFPETADDAVLQVDPAAVEPHRLTDPQPCPVEELDQSPVAKRPRCRAVRGLDQSLDLARGERSRQAVPAPRKVDLGRRVVLAPAQKDEVVVERTRRGSSPDDGRRRLAARAQVGEPGLQFVRACTGGSLVEEPGQVGEVAAVGVDCPRRPASGEEREERLDLGVRRGGGPGRRRA